MPISLSLSLSLSLCVCLSCIRSHTGSSPSQNVDLASALTALSPTKTINNVMLCPNWVNVANCCYRMHPIHDQCHLRLSSLSYSQLSFIGQPWVDYLPLHGAFEWTLTLNKFYSLLPCWGNHSWCPSQADLSKWKVVLTCSEYGIIGFEFIVAWFSLIWLFACCSSWMRWKFLHSYEGIRITY